jgi:hypothetical protein
LFSTASPSTIVKTGRVADFYLRNVNDNSYGFAATNTLAQVAQRETLNLHARDSQFSAILHETGLAPSMPQEFGMIPDLIAVHDLAAK